MEYIYVNLINLMAIALKYIVSASIGTVDSYFTIRTVAVFIILLNSLLFPIVYRYVIKSDPRIFLFSVYSILSGVTVLLFL